MTRDEFAALAKGDQVRDRQGVVWTATAGARDKGTEIEAWLRSGDRVRRATSWDASIYEVVEG